MSKSVEVKLKVSRKIKEGGIQQITLLGLPQREDKKPLSFSKGVVDTIKFPVKNGDETVTAILVVGSSSSIRREHQDTAGVAVFDKLYKRLSEPQTVEGKVVDPLGVEVPVTVEVEEASKAALDGKSLGISIG
jgi:hypothetical protein